MHKMAWRMVVVGISLCAAPLWAEDSYLIFAEQPPSTTTTTFVKLLRSELNNHKDVLAEISSESCTTTQCAADNGADATYAIFVDAVRLGYLYKYDISVVSPKTGERIFHTTTGKANPAEIDVVAKRSAEAIVKRDSFTETLARGEAVEGETQPPKLRDVRITYGGSLGAAYPFRGVDKGQTQVNIDFGLALTMDAFAFELNFPVRFNQSGSSKNTETGFDLLGRYYILKKNFSPFVVAGVGVHALKETNVNTKWGFAGIGGLGVSFLRTTKIEVPVTLKYQYLSLSGIKDAQSVVGTVGIYF